jgi:hypothetical protein
MYMGDDTNTFRGYQIFSPIAILWYHAASNWWNGNRMGIIRSQEGQSRNRHCPKYTSGLGILGKPSLSLRTPNGLLLTATTTTTTTPSPSPSGFHPRELDLYPIPQSSMPATALLSYFGSWLRNVL